MIDNEDIATELRLVQEHGPLTRMRMIERENGWRLINPGYFPWFKHGHFEGAVISYKDSDVRIVSIKSVRPGRGHFKCLVRGIIESGMNPTTSLTQPQRVRI